MTILSAALMWGTAVSPHFAAAESGRILAGCGQLGDGTRPGQHLTAPVAVAVRTTAPGARHTLVFQSGTLTPPSIVEFPRGRSDNCQGMSSTLTVRGLAVGGGRINYPWFRGNSDDTSPPPTGATSAGHTSPALLETTSHWVPVSNDVGTTDSATATIQLTGQYSYAEWMVATMNMLGLAGLVPAPGGDFDGDGVANLLEFAYGTNPFLRNSVSSPGVSCEAIAGTPHLVLTHRRAKGRAFHFTYRISDDLVNWAPAEPIITILDPDLTGDGLIELVAAAVPCAKGGRQFITLTATNP